MTECNKGSEKRAGPRGKGCVFRMVFIHKERKTGLMLILIGVGA